MWGREGLQGAIGGFLCSRRVAKGDAQDPLRQRTVSLTKTCLGLGGSAASTGGGGSVEHPRDRLEAHVARTGVGQWGWG